MVWRKNGKYGFYTSGKTLRADLSGGRGVLGSCSDHDGVVLKQVRNLVHLTANEINDFIYENDIDDGIGALNDVVGSRDRRSSRDRFLRSSGDVQFSLGKKKRWLIPETVLEADDESIIVVERRLHDSQALRKRGDCEAVYDGRKGCVIKPTHRFCHVGDLEPKTRDPYVRYEICKGFPKSTWPRNAKNPLSGCNCCLCSGNYRNPNKSASKNKHFKNKGYRWGHFRCHDLLQAPQNEHNLNCQTFGSRGLNEQNRFDMGKVKVVSRGDFKRPTEAFHGSKGTVFDMGEYISSLLHTRASCDKKKQRKNQIKKVFNLKESVCKHEKNNVSAAKLDNLVSKSVESVVDTKPLTVNIIPENKLLTQVELNNEAVEPKKLKQMWGRRYQEGMSHPRKFAIDLNSLISTCHHGSMSVLFEILPQNTDNISEVICASVSLVDAFNPEHKTDSKKLFPEVAEEFSQCLQPVYVSDAKTLFTVKDIVELAVHVINKHTSKHILQQKTNASYVKKPKRTIRAMEMFSEVLGIEMKPMELTEALLEVKHSCSMKQDIKGQENFIKESSCDICFMDAEDDESSEDETSFTTLNTCGHSFCNECWEICLRTQITEGRTPVMCPGYQCKMTVDDVTIMSMVPSLYGRYQNLTLNKTIEKNPEWTWCPANSCNMVIKINSLGAMGDISTSSASKLPLAVSCACGATTCKLCLMEAHWPASCTQARQFISISKTYEALIREEGKDLITSVEVRKCPSCLYPIEKHLGCNFMYCIMCQTSYCWNCLVTMDKHGPSYSCKQPPKSSEVVPLPLSFMSSHFNAAIDIAIKNRIARQRGMHKFRQAVQKIQRALSTPAAKFTPISLRSVNRKGLKGLVKKIHDRLPESHSGLVTTLKSLADFKYMCHFILEGTAMAVCGDRRNKRKLRRCMLQLQFVTDQINCLVTEQAKSLLLRPETGKSLQNWCRNGRKCISSIKKLTHNCS